jgi:hypothetical protein
LSQIPLNRKQLIQTLGSSEAESPLVRQVLKTGGINEIKRILHQPYR